MRYKLQDTHLDSKRYFLVSNHTECSKSHEIFMWRSWVRAPSKAPAVSLSKKLYPCYSVLVGSRNGFERDHNQTKIN